MTTLKMTDVVGYKIVKRSAEGAMYSINPYFQLRYRVLEPKIVFNGLFVFDTLEHAVMFLNKASKKLDETALRSYAILEVHYKVLTASELECVKTIWSDSKDQYHLNKTTNPFPKGTVITTHLVPSRIVSESEIMKIVDEWWRNGK